MALTIEWTPRETGPRTFPVFRVHELPIGLDGSAAPPLDPRLREIVVDLEHGEGASTANRRARVRATDDVSVLALVERTRPQRFPEGLRVRNIVAFNPRKPGGLIVTGLVRADRILEVRRNSLIISLKLADVLTPTLTDEQLTTIGLVPRAGLGQRRTLGRTPVLVGVVDREFAIGHPAFARGGDPTRSRIVAMWDQRAPAPEAAISVRGSFGRVLRYGRVHDRNDIERAIALATEAGTMPLGANDALGAPIASLETHGTNVAAVAAGTGSSPGVAPEMPLAFVQLKEDVLEPGTASGDSASLVDAISFIFDVADEMAIPAVVNISLGSALGPHDGTSIVERAMDALLFKKHRGRAIVVAAGNSGSDGTFASRTIPPGDYDDLDWVLPDVEPQSRTRLRELDLWYSVTDTTPALTIEFDDGVKSTRPLVNEAGEGAWTLHVRPDSMSEIEQRVGLLVHRPTDRLTPGLGHVYLRVDPSLLGGATTIRVRFQNRSTASTRLDAWVDTHDRPGRSEQFRASAASKVQNGDSSISALACGFRTISVGAFIRVQGGTADDPETWFRPLAYSSMGPTRDGRSKPDVAAVHGVQTSVSSTFGGTSAAAPQVAGVVALLLSNAPDASAEELLEAIRVGASAPPKILQELDIRRVGRGILNASASAASIAGRRSSVRGSRRDKRRSGRP